MKYFITGGAGFIGSNFTNYLLKNPKNEVTIYDSFINGHTWHLKNNKLSSKLTIVKADICDMKMLKSSINDHDIVYH